MSEGTSSARTIVASMRTASAIPTPISLTMMICEVAKAPTAMQKRRAAAVMMRPVRSSPMATASWLGDSRVPGFLDAGEQEDP